MTLSVGFRSLEMTAFGVLQSYTDIRYGIVFRVQHSAADCAESCRRSKASGD